MIDPNQTPRDTDEQVIERVRELDAKATKGPFKLGGIFNPNTPEAFQYVYGNDVNGNPLAVNVLVANAELFAESRTLLPDLASRLASALERERALRVDAESALLEAKKLIEHLNQRDGCGAGTSWIDERISALALTAQREEV